VTQKGDDDRPVAPELGQRDVSAVAPGECDIGCRVSYVDHTAS